MIRYFGETFTIECDDNLKMRGIKINNLKNKLININFRIFEKS